MMEVNAYIGRHATNIVHQSRRRPVRFSEGIDARGVEATRGLSWEFPDYTYQITWPAPGSPQSGDRVRQLLKDAGLKSAANDRRGYDHGVFIPLKVAFPHADVPVVQLSMQRGLDPATDLAIGRALRPWREQCVFIIGSGQTYHNMRGFSAAGADAKAEAFDAWLRQSVIITDTREQSLMDWERALGARNAQPHEDQLFSLMIAAGAALGEPAIVDFHGYALGNPISGLRFG